MGSIRKITFIGITILLCWSARAFADLADDLIIEKPEAKTPANQDKKPSDKKTPTDPSPIPQGEGTESDLNPTPMPQFPSNSKKSGTKSKYSAFDSNSSPIEYTSVGGLNANRAKGYIEMVKEVKIRQGDLELYSDSARANIDPVSEEITQIIADGNVRVKKIDPETGKLMLAQAQQAVYYRMANKIEFKGAAKLNRGGDTLEGDVITYNLQTGDIHVTRPKGVLSEEVKK